MLTAEEVKKYKRLDQCLQYVNGNFITINDKDREVYSKDCHQILNVLRARMQQVDDMFKHCEGTTLLAGSSFDKTKIGKPDEFDMNLEIKLPAAWKNADDIVVRNASASYVTINIKKGMELCDRDEVFRKKYYRGFTNWMDPEGYLLQDLFHSWMESVVTKALNSFPADNGYRLIQTNNRTFKVKHDKSGPAMTLRIQDARDPSYKIDVDLVPVIQFNSSPKTRPIWPGHPVRPNPFANELLRTWCAVPKPKKCAQISRGNREWRISFAQQERELLYRKERMKNTIRQLKKLKGCHEETKKLPSYFVKTMFLWELIEGDADIWVRWSDAALFMFMLKKLLHYLERGELPFYWDRRNNLLDACGPAVANMRHKVARVIKEIENTSMEDPTVLAKFMLDRTEFGQFELSYRLRSLRIDGAGDDLFVINKSDDTTPEGARVAPQKEGYSCNIQ